MRSMHSMYEAQPALTAGVLILQLWACCPDHKLAVLTAVMENMRRPQMMKPQEAAAAIS
jgi:hypothetical protein